MILLPERNIASVKKVREHILSFKDNNLKHLEEKGYIFNIQKFSIHDGEGIRTTVFFKGCPLRCQWCSNPESQNKLPEIFYNEELCSNCKRCEVACKKGYSKSSKSLPVFKDECFLDCDKRCIEECPSGALSLTGEEINVNSIISVINEDKDFYFTSGGGVTLSGGEPFYQEKFLYGMLTACNFFRYNVGIETCGYFKYESNLESLELIDFLLYDLKIVDEAKHIAYTGASNNLIKKNLIKLLDANKEIIIRIPLIPGINDSREDVVMMIDFLNTLRGSIKDIHLLSYHKLGTNKYKSLQRDYKLEYLDVPSKQEVEIFRQHFINNGLNLEIIG
jgi:pyruvate formate lyase activating enzyme